MSIRRKLAAWVVGLVLILPFWAAGFGMALQQDHAIRTWTTVPATIISSQVRIKRGSKGSKNYSPDIVYEYQAQGRTYTSDKVFYFKEDPSKERTHALVAAHPAGAAAEAYVDPNDPERAMLVREHTGLAYLIGSAALVFGAIVLTLILSPASPLKAAPAPLEIGDGWFLLAPARAPRTRMWGSLGIAAMLLVGGGLLLGHAFAVMSSVGGIVVVFSAIIAIGVIIEFGRGVRAWLALRRIADLRTFIDRPILEAGQPFSIRVEMLALEGTRLEGIAAQTRCRRVLTQQKGAKAQSATQSLHAFTTALIGKAVVGPESMMTVNGAAIIPPDADGSTFRRGIKAKAMSGAPMFYWEIGVNARVEGSPAVDIVYPVEVHGLMRLSEAIEFGESSDRSTDRPSTATRRVAQSHR